MAFRSALERLADAMLAELPDLLAVDSGGCYFGARQSNLTQGVQVRLEDGGHEEASLGGPHARTEQVVQVTLYRRDTPGPDGSASANLREVARLAEVLADRFRAARPYQPSLPDFQAGSRGDLPDLISTRAAITSRGAPVDDDPELVTAEVLVTGIFSGRGLLAVGAGSMPAGDAP